MSNLHPPQTYTRLFRPWDFTPSSSPAKDTSAKKDLKKISVAGSSVMEIENSGNVNERECVSSNSRYSRSSYEENYNINIQTESPVRANNLQYPLTYNNTHIYSATHFGPHMHNTARANGISHFLPSVPPTYYVAAAAAVANGLSPTTPAAAAAANYALDPYGLNLMEHEYVRVMAEDAQLKAVNARKQRPKKFKCPYCEVAFSNNGQLKGHIRIHTGERPFHCDVLGCGKTFTRNEELTRHRRIHTGIKPYSCATCGKKFGRRDHLKKHMKTHMPQERQMGPAFFLSMYPYFYNFK